MENGRKIKVTILFIISLLSSLLTFLDYIIVDPVPFVDEIGFSGVTTALWGFFIVAVRNSKKNNKKELDKDK